MKKQNKIIEEIYTLRTITVFSVFCALFIAALFVFRTDELKLYIASKAILMVSSTVALVGAVLWMTGKVKKELLRTYTLSFIGQLVFFSALSAVLLAFLIKDGYGSDAFGVLLAYGILCTALYTVYAAAKDSFSHAVATVIGVVSLYVLRHFQGGSKFYYALAAVCVISVLFLVFSILRKKEPKSELFAIAAASVVSVGASVIFALKPPLFFYIIGALIIQYFVVRLFVKL